MCFPFGSDSKESTCNAGDPSSIPGSWRPPGGGHGNPLQYSCLENFMDRGIWKATAHEATRCPTWLSDSHFTFTTDNTPLFQNYYFVPLYRSFLSAWKCDICGIFHLWSIISQTYHLPLRYNPISLLSSVTSLLIVLWIRSTILSWPSPIKTAFIKDPQWALHCWIKWSIFSPSLIGKSKIWHSRSCSPFQNAFLF